MKKYFCALFVGLFFTAAAMPASAIEIGARGYYWFPAFSMDMSVDMDDAEGSVRDMKDDLGVDTQFFPSVEAYAGLGRHHLSLMYTQVDYSGDARLSADVTFKGENYTAGENVETELKFDMFDLEYKIDMIDLENLLAGFSLSAIGQIKYMDGSARMKEEDGNPDETETFQLPIPMVGLGAHIGILANILEARAKIVGIGYSDNYFIEAMGDVSWTPFPFLDLGVGYRHIQLKVDESDVYLNGSFSGPYVALTVGF